MTGKSVLSQYFPTRGGQTAKVATGQADPGPDSSHPAHIATPIVPPTGDVMAAAASVTTELVGDKAVTGGTEGSVKDKKPETLETQTGTIDVVPTTPLQSRAPDFGADDHPAKSGGEKFASCATVEDVLAVMQNEIAATVSKVAALEAAKTASAPQPATPAPVNTVAKLATVGDRLSFLLSGATPAETAARRTAACSKVASFLSPLVQEGVQLAEDFINFTKLAEMDPAAAAELVGGGEDPAAMGGMPPMDPAAMGGMPPMDPAAMGGMPPMDPAAGGDGGGQPSMEEIEAAINAIAQEEGITPQEVVKLLEAEVAGGSPEGGAEGGGDPGASAPADAPMSGAAVTGGESSAAPASDPAAGDSEAGEKTAASPEIIRKFAQYLSKEINLGVPEVAALRSVT